MPAATIRVSVKLGEMLEIPLYVEIESPVGLKDQRGETAGAMDGFGLSLVLSVFRASTCPGSGQLGATGPVDVGWGVGVDNCHVVEENALRV